MLTSEQIRNDFLDFFAKKNHEIVKSAPVVPMDDPTLLFTNAGMNQFKDVFLGQGTRKYNRAADTQKCIRVSGKHNDLDEVGRDNYHHTFFEMLGNWSFGNYYKKEAIVWAWELLTEVWKLPKDRLYATVYQDDDEAFDLWANETDIGAERILRCGAKDNYWEMGDTGPCGPCSEIHYDRTPDKSGKELVNKDSEDVIEIWNLVFIQSNRKKDGSLENLPEKHVDTGMGFERVVAILQEKKSNYDTDVFTPILNAIEKITGSKYGSVENGVPHQVVADHIRMLAFSIADGAMPSNADRGYVLRRVLRRGALFGRKLGMHQPFMHKLVDIVAKTYVNIFPELTEQAAHIAKLIKSEEESFHKTLDRGIDLFEKKVTHLKKGEQLSGEIAFKLYDTFGFPVDLTQRMADDRGFLVDMPAYENAMKKAQERSRTQTNFSIGDEEHIPWIINFEDEDATEFIGYERTHSSCRILKYRMIDEKKKKIQFIIDESPFYAESGGQIGDQGKISGNGVEIKVTDTQKQGDAFLLTGIFLEGEISQEPVMAFIDKKRRNNIRRNHTATHLLHQALQDILGEHIQQKGSLVSSEHLRFDFAHNEAITAEELEKIESVINNKIIENLTLENRILPLEEAKAEGATALFGEKYEDIVRTVKIGDYSFELCGGTHCHATGDIGLCKIIHEGSVSSGVRRIEAVTGAKAFSTVADYAKNLSFAASALNCRMDEVPVRLDDLLAKNKKLQKELEDLKKKSQGNIAIELADNAKNLNDIKLINAVIEVDSVDGMKDIAHNIRKNIQTGVCVLGANLNGKAMLVVAITDNLVEKGMNSSQIIRPIAEIIGGGGGGHPKMAQAGGKNPAKLQEAINSAEEIVKTFL